MAAAQSGERSTPQSAGVDLSSLLAISRAVADTLTLGDVLDRIAREAVIISRARSASILLCTQQPPDKAGYWFRVGGTFGLGATYRDFTNHPTGDAFVRKGPATLAIERGQPIVSADVAMDPVFVPWLEVARQEGYQAAAIFPLFSADQPLGTLDVYRECRGAWGDSELLLLSLFADFAATAIRTASLIDRQRRQVDALSRVVSGLREQGHEHANRIHTIAGLLALGDYAEARRFAETMDTTHHAEHVTIVRSIGAPVLAGLILAETSIARQRGIAVTLSPGSRIDQLPPQLNDEDAVTIVGNLLQNAVDAVAAQPRRLRRVSLTFASTKRDLRFIVRDWGPGIAAEHRARVCSPGFTTKPGHGGIGLALVSDVLLAVGGSLLIEHLSSGTRITVRLPLS